MLPKSLEKIFVVPGPGRKVPLPLPGGGVVPAAGALVLKSMKIQRLLRSGDLVVAEPPPPAPAATEPEKG